MTVISDAELIRALRCSCSPLPDDSVCRECPYCIAKTFEGRDWSSCDCDRIGMDAAARLEELTGK